MRHNSTVIAQK